MQDFAAVFSIANVPHISCAGHVRTLGPCWLCRVWLERISENKEGGVA
jgi:hypothetical protein